jgi:tetratricopeptide (TPR) repeat protein
MSRQYFLLACGCGLLAARGATPSLAPPEPAAAAAPADASSFHQGESDLPDSVGAVTVRPVPEPGEDLPAFVQQADYLVAHHDNVAAADYLEKVARSPSVSARDRARVILQLADCLQAIHRPGAELCWLKIWMQLYPDRTEVGAVAYRMGAVYTEMGLTGLARDSFYLALANAINHGAVQSAGDLAQYTKLTTGTLRALAENEYGSGDWQRAAELFDRYRHEAPSADAASLARAEFLQADCYYQLHQAEPATAAYQAALKDHPFHPLAPSARLRLYHLDLVAGHPEEAQQELEALVWTVRTAWPKDEARWQKQTAELLLALNRKDGAVLPPLLAKSAQLAGPDPAWQADLGHYERLARLEATLSPASPEAREASRLHRLRRVASPKRTIWPPCSNRSMAWLPRKFRTIRNPRRP